MGPAAYRATTKKDGLRNEANPQVDSHIIASPQVVESVSRTLCKVETRVQSRWDCRVRGVSRRGHAAEHRRGRDARVRRAGAAAHAVEEIYRTDEKRRMTFQDVVAFHRAVRAAYRTTGYEV